MNPRHDLDLVDVLDALVGARRAHLEDDTTPAVVRIDVEPTTWARMAAQSAGELTGLLGAPVHGTEETPAGAVDLILDNGTRRRLTLAVHTEIIADRPPRVAGLIAELADAVDRAKMAGKRP